MSEENNATINIRLITSKGGEDGGYRGDADDLEKILDELRLYIPAMRPGAKIVITKEVEQ